MVKDKKISKKEGLNFHEHISRFFSDPKDFFEKTKNESFLDSVKYFGLFLLLNLVFVFVSVFMRENLDFNLSFILGFSGVLVFMYAMFPIFLFASAKILKLKVKLSKIFSLYLYVVSFLILINILLSLVFGFVVQLLTQSFFAFIAVNMIGFLILTLVGVALVYYLVEGLNVYFNLGTKKSFWTILLFLVMLFLIVGVLVGLIGGVSGIGSSTIFG